MLCSDSDMPLPFTSAGQPDKPIFSSSKETSLIVVEKKDEITASLGASNSSRMVDGSSRSAHDAAEAGGAQVADVAAGAVTETGPVAPSGTDAVKTTAIASSTQVVFIYTHAVLTNIIYSVFQ